jgi:hypothetical protein
MDRLLKMWKDLRRSLTDSGKINHLQKMRSKNTQLGYLWVWSRCYASIESTNGASADTADGRAGHGDCPA